MPKPSLSYHRSFLNGVNVGKASQLCRRYATSSVSSSKTSSPEKTSSYAPIISSEVPPESPRYIHIPRPPQIQAKERRPQKGLLPRPRAIPFRRDKKLSPGYLEKVTPGPSNIKPLPEGLSVEQKDYIEYKARQAALRRQNLREGLQELHQREQAIKSRLEAKAAKNKAINERKQKAPEREDERLTKASILPSMLPGALKIQRDPDWEAKLEEKKERYRRKHEAKVEERRSALHTLYINAKDFIVTEAALARKVDEEFDDPFYRDNPDRGIWDKEGIPETTSWLLAQSSGTGRPGASGSKDYVELSRERVQRVAEDLTGGKM